MSLWLKILRSLPKSPSRSLFELGMVFALGLTLTIRRRIMMNKSLLHLLLALFSFPLLTSSCALVIEDEPKEYKGHIYYWPDSDHYHFDQCRDDDDFSYCGSKPDQSDKDYSWKPNCTSDDCQSVSLFVHYQLFEDLGPRTSLWIEAFDNPYFNGQAQSIMRIANFDASYPHSTEREEIYLDPGEYYFRAFISTKNDSSLPPELQGLEPAEGAFGIFGALSSPERVIIKPYDINEPIHIYIDQLYKDPNHTVDTQAQIRVKMAVDGELTIPRDRDVLVQFSTTADIEKIPEYQMKISSNMFFADSVPRAEARTESLPITSYYIFAFIDENSNELYDSGELAGYYFKGDEPWPVAAKEKSVRTVELDLTLYPRLP